MSAGLHWREVVLRGEPSPWAPPHPRLAYGLTDAAPKIDFMSTVKATADAAAAATAIENILDAAFEAVFGPGWATSASPLERICPHETR